MRIETVRGDTRTWQPDGIIDAANFGLVLLGDPSPAAFRVALERAQ